MCTTVLPGAFPNVGHVAAPARMHTTCLESAMKSSGAKGVCVGLPALWGGGGASRAPSSQVAKVGQTLQPVPKIEQCFSFPSRVCRLPTVWGPTYVWVLWKAQRKCRFHGGRPAVHQPAAQLLRSRSSRHSHSRGALLTVAVTVRQLLCFCFNLFPFLNATTADPGGSEMKACEASALN